MRTVRGFPLTRIEARVLAQRSLRLDPYRHKGAERSASITQAWGRLRKLGFLALDMSDALCGDRITSDGERALAITWRHYMELGLTADRPEPRPRGPCVVSTVVRWSEEWRARGRVALWLVLECRTPEGDRHCEQRLVRLERDGTFKVPARVQCSECLEFPAKPPELTQA